VSNIERLKVLTGESDEELLSLLLKDAEEFVLSYTNRTVLITQLGKTIRDLALIAYNRRGTEGENSRSEGGESYNFNDAPKQIFDVLNRYRLARIGGEVYENTAKQNTAILPSEPGAGEG